ncbi:MAG: tetratricopeptide repeat protein, partial [Bacteroidota bacterium]
MNKVYLAILIQIVCTIFFIVDSHVALSQPADTVALAQVRQMPERVRIPFLNKLSKKYSADSTDLSIELANEAWTLAKRYYDRRQEAIALVNLAEGYLYNDLYDKTLLYNSDALEIFDELGDPFDAALALTSLGWLYYDVADPQNSLQYHQRALEILRNSSDKERLTT